MTSTAPPPTSAALGVPTPLSSLVGRAHELDAVSRLLERTRLLTLTGVGGAGKTRLAREVASRTPGALWVELAPVAAASELPQAVAAVMRVSAAPGSDLVDVVAESLRDAPALLVLDNCEHVVDAAAVLVERLLRLVPGLRVLATSREALGVEGEVAWPVPPLSHPAPPRVGDTVDVSMLGAFEAVQLFVERARAVQPAFRLTMTNADAVATICARLDGLPLALELAAASVGVFGVERLAAQLDDALSVLTRGRRTALPRHQTLRALLDWSYALLGPAERTLLQRLSVFRGHFTLDAIAAVCGDEGADAPLDAIVEPLGRLVAQSLVTVQEEAGDARYALLETVRQYGAALLRGTPAEAALRARHARWIATMAEAQEAALWSAQRGRTVEALRHDVDDVRAALAWATGRDGDAATAVHIAAGIDWFWLSGVPWDEARRWLDLVHEALERERVDDRARPVADRAAIAKYLYPHAGLYYFAGEPQRILPHTARALALWASVLEDPAASPALRAQARRGRAMMWQVQGLAHGLLGEHDAAINAMDTAVRLAREAHEPWVAGVMRIRRALILIVAGRNDAAREDYLGAADELRAVGERWFLSLCLEGLAENETVVGDLAAAAAHARESVAVLRAEPDRWFISRSLDLLATIALRADPAQAPHAVRLMGAAEALRRRCGATVIGVDRERHAWTRAAAEAALAPDAFDEAWKAGLATTLAGAFELAAVPVVPEPTPAQGVPAVAAPAIVVAAASAPTLRILAFGPLAVHRGDDGEAPEWPSGKVKELLLFLLLNPPRTKAQIGLALWPDASPTQVRNLFHVTMHRLRAALGGRDWVVFAPDADAYLLSRAPDDERTLDVDVDAAIAAAERLRAAQRRRSALDAGELAALRAALSRAERGALGEGVAAGDWLVEHEDRVRAALEHGGTALAQLLAAQGDHAGAAEAWRALVGRAPLLESAHRGLMESWAALGEPGRALAHYAELTALLQREVGAAPARETAALADRLRRGAAAP